MSTMFGGRRQFQLSSVGAPSAFCGRCQRVAAPSSVVAATCPDQLLQGVDANAQRNTSRMDALKSWPRCVLEDKATAVFARIPNVDPSSPGQVKWLYPRIKSSVQRWLELTNRLTSYAGPSRAVSRQKDGQSQSWAVVQGQAPWELPGQMASRAI